MLTHLTRLHPLGARGLTLSSIVLLSYLLCAQGRLRGASDNNHFAYLAQAMLAGELALTSKPPHGNDWASYDVLELRGQSTPVKGVFIGPPPRGARSSVFETLSGDQLKLTSAEIKRSERRYYVSFPPLPALLMMPLVAIFGLAASDVWLTLLCAALNVPLTLSLLREITRSRTAKRARHQRADSDLLWITVSLTLGTAHFWSAVRGEVWFTALIVGVTTQLLFFRWAWAMRRPLLAGFALAAAFSTRASLITLAVFAYAQLLFPFRATPIRDRVRATLIFSIPPLFIGSALLWYNYVRFEQWYEFGHRYLAGGQIKRIQTYGLFHWQYLKKNLIAAFLLLPMLSLRSPLLTLSWHGMAIQASSPQLLWGLRPNASYSALTRPRLALTLTLITTLTLLLFYQNTGWVQYSWRFGLDIIPALCCLIALSDRPLGAWFRVAVCWGVIVNLVGAITFGRAGSWWTSVNLPSLLPH